LDGELSSFEHALLHDHLARCADCRAFTESVSGLTLALRAAPPEPYAGVVITRPRRHLHVPLTKVAAAVAVAAIGLGSLLASVQLRGSNVGSNRPLQQTPAIGGPDALSLRSLVALERQRSVDASSTPTRATPGGRTLLEP
jgi:predicted anti-sigma-YlaC factor YlaD